MYKKYNIKDNIAGIQNLLINESIRETANVQLLKSEEAIKTVLESYASKFNATGGKLIDMAQHYAESKTIITTEQFNDLFNGIYIDLKTLYSELSYVDQVLKLNLGRNKKFFGILKKRIRDLWNKLYLTRMNITDSSVFDESYFEGFSSLSSEHTYSNVIIDKKTGVMKLNPKTKKIQNKNYLIKKINTTTYPVHNNDGGVRHTTSELNKYEYNYSESGTRDMLENGLWKEQVICNDVPELHCDITGSGTYKDFNGILSLIDIEYTYPVEINNIDLDFFGESPTTVVAVFTKNSPNDLWVPIKKLTSILYSTNYYDWIDDSKSVAGFDTLSLSNIELVKSKYFRLVLNQENYEILDSSKLNIGTIEDKINNDLAERRYDIVKLDGGSDDLPAIPKSNALDSFYVQITDIIENTRSLEETLQEIVDTLEPPPKLQTLDFQKTLKYEVGLWSMDPTSKKYLGIGRFDSGDYELKDKSLINVSLNSKQEDIKHNTCNWYISSPTHSIDVPIIENKSIVRKEPALLVRPKYYYDMSWDGYFIHLDFPMDLKSLSYTKIYRNGTLLNLSQLNYIVMNSTLIYIDEIDDPLKNDYVIQYVPASYSTVNVYYIEKIKEYSVNDVTEYELIAPRRSLLTYLLDINTLNETYSIKRSTCTTQEYEMYFTNNANLCLSINANAIITESSLFNKNIVTEFRSTQQSQYDDGIIPRDIIGAVPPAIPIRIRREL